MTRTNSPDENDTGTGRYLVLLQEDSAAAGLRTMARTAGLRVASTADVSSVGAYDSLREADGLLLHDLGVAVVRAARDQVDYLARAVERADHWPTSNQNVWSRPTPPRRRNPGHATTRPGRIARRNP